MEYKSRHMSLPVLNLEDASKYQRTTLVTPRRGTGIPHGHGLKLLKLIGKGSNNAVYLYKTKHGEMVVVRQPRRKSDTQRVGNATWEFRNTAIAVQIGVAPLLYDAWYNRHATTDQRGGLHIICEYFPKDLHALIMDTPEAVKALSSGLRERTVSHLRRMAESGLFCYDLKPSNMVFRDEPFDVRLIDFGRDFCEWRPYSDNNEYLERAPVCSYIQSLAEQHKSPRYTAQRLYIDLTFAVMLLILSSNISITLDQSRTASRRSFADNQILNFMSSAARDLREQTSGAHIQLLKKILRQRDIRDTLRHYMGRRNCGTKRCFHYAGFVSNATPHKKKVNADRQRSAQKLA